MSKTFADLLPFLGRQSEEQIRSRFQTVAEKGVFQNIAGEDPSITTIRKYYFALAGGSLEAAYAFYSDQSVSFDTFK